MYILKSEKDCRTHSSRKYPYTPTVYGNLTIDIELKIDSDSYATFVFVLILNTYNIIKGTVKIYICLHFELHLYMTPILKINKISYSSELPKCATREILDPPPFLMELNMSIVRGNKSN